MAKVVRKGTPGAVYIGRPTIYGNPYPMRSEADREQVIEDYRLYFKSMIEKQPFFKKKMLELKDKDLACFCAPKPCHGDVILEWLEKQG